MHCGALFSSNKEEVYSVKVVGRPTSSSQKQNTCSHCCGRRAADGTNKPVYHSIKYFRKYIKFSAITKMSPPICSCAEQVRKLTQQASVMRREMKNLRYVLKS